MSSQLSGFPTSKPAFFLTGKITTITPFGQIYSGANLTHIEVPTGTIESVPGFEPAFKATITFGADFFSIDANGKHGRVDVRAIAKTDDGFGIEVRCQGVIKLEGPVAKIFTMAPDMATVPYGYTTGSATLIVGDPKLKALENGVFITNSRFTVGEDGVGIEMKSSLVVASTADN